MSFLILRFGRPEDESESKSLLVKLKLAAFKGANPDADDEQAMAEAITFVESLAYA